LYANDTKQTGSGEFQVQYYATNNVFKDNIIYASASQDLFFNNYTKSESNPVDVDYNLYYSTDAANAQWIWNGKTYTGFLKYQTGAGKDGNSHFANPQFLSTSTPNLNVGSGSPAIGTGVVLSGGVNGTVDFAGNPRTVNGLITIGAYEQ
jgi:TFIIF-interacting CTD phosphatase-like protein